MVGAVLQYKGWSKNIFKVLFSGIDVSIWEFDVKYWESYGENSLRYDFNELDVIESELIKQELINKNSVVYPEFLEMFISNKAYYKETIKKYEDFIKSQYFISLIIIDHRNIEICCKDSIIMNQILSNFEKSELTDIKIDRLETIHQSSVLSAYRSKNEKGICD